jgi:putative ABC transport system permease protein
VRALSHGNVKASWKAVRRNRARSFLTMLGIIIGVSSVISVVSIGEGVKHQVTQQINHVGDSVITVRAGQLSTSVNNRFNLLSGLRVNGSLSPNDLSSVQQSAKGSTVVPLAVIGGTVSADKGVYRTGPVIATNQDLPRILNQSMEYGAFFPSGVNTNVAILGVNAAQRMFNDEVPLGDTFTFMGQQFTVGGIFNTFYTPPLSTDIDFNNAIYIPYTIGQQLTNNSLLPYEILVKPASLNQVNKTVSTIRSGLIKNHGDSNDFSVLKESQTEAATDSVLSLLTELIGGAAAISLFVGGIGIMNITLVSVTERMHEIGIRKAVGATNRQILNEFMTEAIVLSVTGGLLGIVAAGVVDIVLRLTTSLAPVMQWQVVVLAAGLSIIIGILFGTAPALKAARKDPIAALRNE